MLPAPRPDFWHPVPGCRPLATVDRGSPLRRDPRLPSGNPLGCAPDALQQAKQLCELFSVEIHTKTPTGTRQQKIASPERGFPGCETRKQPRSGGTSGASVLLLHDCIHLDARLRSSAGDNWGLDIRVAPRLSTEPALKARSRPAQGSTLGKPALLGSCALQGRRLPFPQVSKMPFDEC